MTDKINDLIEQNKTYVQCERCNKLVGEVHQLEIKNNMPFGSKTKVVSWCDDCISDHNSKIATKQNKR